MRKKVYILFSILCFCSYQTFAQTSLRQARIINTNVGKSNNTQKNTIVADFHPTKLPTPTHKNSIKTYSNDTIYCTQTKKQHGWFAPMDTISMEIACHRNHYYRFTRKNSAGNWERMECLDSYGKYRTGAMMPYILKLGDASESDQTAKKEWIDKLNKTCIYDFISDYTGKTIIQERAYNEERNIIYSYSRVPIGNNQFNGSYRDMNGMPAEMREEADYVYGTLVRITEDQWGNDSIIQYIDAKGVAKLNSDSVAREVFICDRYGHILKQQSQDLDGSLAIDNWGNCGIEYEWTDKHQIKSATYMDNNWKPMRMPAKRGVTGRENVIKTNYEYDEYLRHTSEYYTDEKGNPDINTLGTHKIIYRYDNHGNMVAQYGYDLQEQLSPISDSNVAVEEYTFDINGKITDACFLDKHRKPCSTEGYLSKIHIEYDTDGNQILIERYSAETGTEKLCSKEETKKNYKFTLWNDGTSRLDSLDSKGRTLFIGFYGKDGNYEMTGGRAYERYTYIDETGKSTAEEIDYDVLGKKVDVNGICRTVILTDSTSWTQTRWLYDSNDVLKESYIHKYSPNFEELIGQGDANSLGIASRGGGSSSVRYYAGNVLRNANGDFVSLYGIDEFGEPDYITTNYITYYYQKQFPHSSTKFYDENNNVIENASKFKDSLPKIMTIEVIDSSAYKVGLRDNDLILIYGDYAVDLDTIVSNLTFQQEWTLRSVIDARKEKSMVVFRITDPSKDEYGLYKINGLNGTCSELGFIPHVRYLTDRQLGRLKESINSAVTQPDAFVSYSDFKKTNNKGGNNYILLAYTEMYRSNRGQPYATQVGDPSILLGSCIKDRNLKWTKVDESDTKPFETMLLSRKSKDFIYPRQDFFVTKDGNSIAHIVLDEQAVCTNWSDAYISDEDYSQITSLYEEVNDNINAIIKSNKSINIKHFYGNWITRNEDSVAFTPKAQFHFSKDGTFEGNIVNYGYIGFTEGYAIFQINKNVSGAWNNGGKWLFFYPNDDEISLSCVDLLGADDEELKQRAISHMNSICESNRDALLERMEYEDNRISGDMFVNSFDKNVLDVQFSSGLHIALIKSKDNLPVSTKEERTKLENYQQRSEYIDISSPLIGHWECQIPHVENSHIEIGLEQDGALSIEASIVTPKEVNDTCTVNIFMDLDIEGKWQPNSSGFMIEINPERLSMNIEYNLIGADKETEKQLIPAIKEYIEPLKTELGLTLLKNLGNEMIVTELDSARMVMNGHTLNRIPSSKDIVVGRVEGNEGYMVEKGYTGLFIILEWCDWNCKQTIDDFATEFEKQLENEKHIVLLPVESANGEDVFNDIIELNSITTRLGLRMIDQPIEYKYYKKNILSRYKEFKANLK